MNEISNKQTCKPVQQFEIRSRTDRNRLLATYDPDRRVMRLYHRGEVVVVNVSDLDRKAIDAPPGT